LPDLLESARRFGRRLDVHLLVAAGYRTRYELRTVLIRIDNKDAFCRTRIHIPSAPAFHARASSRRKISEGGEATA
jgi:hypothetical protein